MVLFHPRYHVRKIIFLIRVFTIGIDADERDALIFKSLYRCTGYFIGTRHVRTVIAGKKDDKYFRLREIGQTVRPSVRRGQREIRRYGAER